MLLGGVVSWSSNLLERASESDAAQQELVYLPPSRFLRAVSLGYEHALADVIWFRAISHFGLHYRTDRVYPWLASLCDVVTDLDPRAEHAYRFGGVILPWEADRVDDGIALLEKGTRNIPDSWQLSYILGFSYYFFRDDLAEASRALRSATLLPNAPDFVGNFAATIEAAHTGPTTAIDFLKEIERRGATDETRSVIRQRVRELLLSRDLQTLEAAVRQYRAQHGKVPRSLEAIAAAGLIQAIPDEPFGGRYVLDATTGGVLATSGNKPRQLGSSQLRELLLRRRQTEQTP
jgi:hypothetical protein